MAVCEWRFERERREDGQGESKGMGCEFCWSEGVIIGIFEGLFKGVGRTREKGLKS